MFSAALLLASAVSSGLQLSDIRMHLFYEGTGRLSPDLTQQRGFAGWNVIIGEGSAEEPANDLLAVIELTAHKGAFMDAPVRITVTGSRGKTLATRNFRTVLVPNSGAVYLPVWVRDAACAGEIRVDARLGKQHRSETIGLECGE